MKNKPAYAIRSVDNALLLAQLLLLEGSLRLTDAAERLQVSPSTAHRLLAMLIYRDFAELGPDKLYRPGPMLQPGTASEAPIPALRRAARPALVALVEQVNESANLVVLAGREVRFVMTVECSQVLRVGDRTGTALPAHLSSGGRAIMALLDEDSRDRILAELPKNERPAIVRHLKAARLNGYAINNQHTETGLTALGMAIRSRDGEPVAAISLAIPSARFRKEKISDWVQAMAACVSRIQDAMQSH